MAYCGQCGGRVYEEDQFCGSCGASVPRDVDQNVYDEPTTVQPAGEARQFAPGSGTTYYGSSRTGGRGLVVLFSSIAVLVVLVGAGAFALVRLDPLGSMSGEAVPPNTGEQAGVPEGAAPLSTVEEESYPEQTQAEPGETVEDEQSPVGSPDDAVSEEEAVEEAIYSHYEAIGDKDFAEAYSYFSSDRQSGVPAQGWIDEQETFDITDSTVYSTEVLEVEGSSAIASVEVGFEDNTGSPAFDITWELLKEAGEWRLDEQTDAQKIQ